MRTKKKQFLPWLGRHKVSIIISIVAVIAAVAFNVWNVSAIEATISRLNKETDTMIQTTDKKLKEIQDKKALEAKIKQEEEAKQAAAAQKAKEEAAKQAAEQAKKAANSSTATNAASACNASQTHNNPASIDILVNKKHCLAPVSFAPADLVTSNGATLSAKAIDAYKRLFAAAAAAGQPFSVTSSYRSYNDQVFTYNYWVKQSGQAGADTYSARPGYSEHQTGLAFDVAANGCTLNCFGSTSQYQWFQQNAADYGFIQRYYSGYEAITGYKSEEWHYRYVGVSIAKDMQAKGIKTLEQYWNIPGGDYN